MKRIVKYYKQLIQDMQIAHENEVNDLKYHIEWLEKMLNKYYDLEEIYTEDQRTIKDQANEIIKLKDKLEEYEKK